MSLYVLWRSVVPGEEEEEEARVVVKSRPYLGWSRSETREREGGTHTGAQQLTHPWTSDAPGPIFRKIDERIDCIEHRTRPKRRPAIYICVLTQYLVLCHGWKCDDVYTRTHAHTYIRSSENGPIDKTLIGGLMYRRYRSICCARWFVVPVGEKLARQKEITNDW